MIELKYPIERQHWERFLSTATFAVARWTYIKGPHRDQYGTYFDVQLREARDLKNHWVLRPATLHLGATKVLQDAAQYQPGWNDELCDLFQLVSLPVEDFVISGVKLSTLDLVVQAAWFRGEVLFT